jgi:elongation factor Ts
MAEISAKAVKELRDKTGVGMMECKKALQESDGDMEKAIEFLRKRGAAMAAKRSDREAKEGVIIAKTTSDATTGVIVEVNCETDFVAKSDDFVKFAQAVADLSLASEVPSAEALASATLGVDFDGQTVGVAIETLTGKIGEKLEIGRYCFIKSAQSVLTPYIHPGSKLATLVEMSPAGSDDVVACGKDIAMQIAAAAPIVIDRSEVTKESIDKESEIFKQQALAEGKPEKIVDKIIIGRLEKYYQDVALLEQTFIKDSSKTVTDVLKDLTKKVGQDVSIKKFLRYQLGEK